MAVNHWVGGSSPSRGAIKIIIPMYTVAALYKFFPFPDYQEAQESLKALCDTHGIKGTLLLATEGINGTVAGTEEAIDALKAYLEQKGYFEGMSFKLSTAEDMPFYRMKVRLKKEIVTLGQPLADPLKAVGRYVEADEWNELIADPDTVVVDTRNDYEVKLGTFKGASNPKTQTFREFPEYVEKELGDKKKKRVAMFCTGGIRCEKSTAYLLEQGFEEVYHLKDGILKYLETVPPHQSLWEGECFVFDQRVTVGHGLEEGTAKLCYACQAPVSDEEQKDTRYVPGVSCPSCHGKRSDSQVSRATERQKQQELARKRGDSHIGQKLSRHSH